MPSLGDNRDRATKMEFDSDYTSLWEYLKQAEIGEKKLKIELNKLQKKLSKELLEQENGWQKASLERLYRIERDLAQRNIHLTEEERKNLILNFERELATEQKKRQLEFLKEQSTAAQKEREEEEKLLDRKIKTAEEVAKIAKQQAELSSKIEKTGSSIKEKQAQLKVTTDKAEQEKLKKEIKEQQKELKEAQKEKSTAEKAEKALEESQKESTFDTAFSEFIKEVKGETTPADVLEKDVIQTLKGIGKAIEEGLNQINNAMSTYANYQTEINARLQGVGDFSHSVEVLSDVAYSPLIKTAELYENLSLLVAEGISANVEQRAFLQTVKKGIATTFDANDSSLRRLIRLQQYDTTAARLGMEAFLTKFMNELVSNTEYLNSTFDSVANSLLEASSLLTAQQSAEFEYVVQKWLGVLSGVGLSESSATGLAQAIGYLGSGNIEALSGSGMQNLLIMAASQSGTDFGSLLRGGLSAQQTNDLLYSVVNYLQKLGESDNNVVKSELARTFGVSIADLQAIANLDKSTLATTYGTGMTYNQMYSSLASQMNALVEREGIANILDNLFSNFTFSTGFNIASNPVTYATWKITDLVQSVTHGINIPFISALGTGIDLETTVENLMKLGIVGVSTIAGIGDIISGISSVFPGMGETMLSQLGIGAESQSNVIRRGKGLATSTSGISQSLSTFVGTTSGEDYTQEALTSAQDSAQQKLAEEKDNELTKSPEQKISDMFEEIDFYNKIVEIESSTQQIVSLLKGTIKVETAGSAIGDIIGLR